jgi:hypothetical protein
VKERRDIGVMTVPDENGVLWGEKEGILLLSFSTLLKEENPPVDQSV